MAESTTCGTERRGMPFRRAYIDNVSLAVIKSSKGSNCGQYPMSLLTFRIAPFTEWPFTHARPPVASVSPVKI